MASFGLWTFFLFADLLLCGFGRFTSRSCLFAAVKNKLKPENWKCDEQPHNLSRPCVIKDLEDVQTRVGLMSVIAPKDAMICGVDDEATTCLHAELQTSNDSPDLQWTPWEKNETHFVREASMTDGVEVQPCPMLQQATLFDCDFDTDICDMDQRFVTDQYDWNRAVAYVTYTYTGPSSAHAGTHFAYLSGYLRTQYNFGTIVTPELHYYGKVCINVWYHMYGANMGTFDIVRIDTELTQKDRLSVSGDQGDVWLLAQVTAHIQPGYRIGFTAIRGNGHRSTIGIDSLVITPHACLPENYDEM